MAYEKANAHNLAVAFFNMGKALSDGFQLSQDSDEMMALVPAGLASMDEFKEDLPSTLMYVGAKLMDLGADLRRTQKEAEVDPPVE